MKFRIRVGELALIFLMITGCHATKNMQVVPLPLPVFDKEGHRGCRGLMPENTIPAMLRAIELGVTTLEMDAVITSDKQVILSHEPFFNHDITTRADGSFIKENEEKNFNIFRMTYAETKQFDVGLKPNPRFPAQRKLAAHKPLLRDVIDSVETFCKKNKLPLPFYNIETKSQPLTDNIFHPAPEEFVNLLMNQVIQKGIAERAIIQSFDFRTLKVLHQKFPAIKTALLIESHDKRSLDQQLIDLGFSPTIYSPEYSLITPELIKDCHKRNLKVIAWTVNDKTKIAVLTRMGVDGIITDFPDLF